MEENTQNNKRWLTVKEASKVFPISEAGWRHLIFMSKKRYNSKGKELPSNLLSNFGVIARVGRKIMIDANAANNFFDAHREMSPECEDYLIS